MDVRISQRKNLRPYPYFQGQIKMKTAKLGQKYLNAHYFQIGSADFSQIRMNLIHGYDKVIRLQRSGIDTIKYHT